MQRRGRLRTTIGACIAMTLAVSLALLIPGCGDAPGTSETIERTTEVQVEPSLPARVVGAQASATDMAKAAASNNAFSVDLFRSVRAEDENLVCSPYSASLALTMTMAGAKGATQDEMRQALCITLPDDRLHQAVNDLDKTLTSGDSFTCANSIWGQIGRNFKQPFVDLVGHYYGASLRLLDMDGDYAGACKTINGWVSDQTNGRITDLMDPADKPDTPLLMMLVNAVHFKAKWQDPFWDRATQPEPFYLLDGGKIDVPMMWRQGEYRFVRAYGLQAVELPYEGGRFAMVVLMPDEGGFEGFTGQVDQKQLDNILSGLEPGRLDLRVPSFEITSTPPVKDGLEALGMKSAFDRLTADFTGIADLLPGWPTWYISDVVQKAFITVDEQGTEAAAATGVTVAAGAMSTTTLPPLEMTIDHPFVYLIRDVQTGVILFIGQVVDPSVGSASQPDA
jgi:serpin B